MQLIIVRSVSLVCFYTVNRLYRCRMIIVYNLISTTLSSDRSVITWAAAALICSRPDSDKHLVSCASWTQLHIVPVPGSSTRERVWVSPAAEPAHTLYTTVCRASVPNRNIIVIHWPSPSHSYPQACACYNFNVAARIFQLNYPLTRLSRYNREYRFSMSCALRRRLGRTLCIWRT